MNARAPAPDLLAEIFGESDHVHAGLAQLEQGRPLWGERAEWIELENRAAQLRMLQAAAESKLTVEHNDVFVVILEKFIRPTMRLRDKMAHWCWGHSPLLPDDLLLVQPDEKTPRHFRAIAGAFELDREKIFVVTGKYLDRIIRDGHTTQDHLAGLIQTVWTMHPPQERARWLDMLSTAPGIQKPLGHRRETRERLLGAPPILPEEWHLARKIHQA
jgi:hypothetical protein